MAIRIITKATKDNLTAKSHWWGFPDLTEGTDFPTITQQAYNTDDKKNDLLTFICQIKLEDIIPYNSESQLPHQGMLYFFAALDYFLGDIDAYCGPIGFWPENSFKIIYTPQTNELHTHKVIWTDGTDACLPAELMFFEITKESECNHKLLGVPYFDEVRNNAPKYISLLQIDEDERWGLRFYDCGMLNFLISKEDLEARRFDKAKLYFHSL